jgi:hypothetical protein
VTAGLTIVSSQEAWITFALGDVLASSTALGRYWLRGYLQRNAGPSVTTHLTSLNITSEFPKEPQ